MNKKPSRKTGQGLPFSFYQPKYIVMIIIDNHLFTNIYKQTKGIITRDPGTDLLDRNP